MADQVYLNVSGRLVQGDVFTPVTTDMKGRPMTDKNGNPKVQYFCAVAVEKNAPDFGPAWQGIQNVANAAFKNGETQRPTFAWKLVDGDTRENANKEGFPGHWVFRFTSGYPFSVVSGAEARPVTNQNEIKRGYYVQVFFTVAGNGDSTKPGVYLNGAVVRFIGYGPEISTGPNAAALVAAAGSGYVPKGAQTTPLAGSGPQFQPPAGQQFQPPAGQQFQAPAGQQFQPPAGQQFQGPPTGPQGGTIPPHYGPLNTGAPDSDLPF